MHERPVKAMTKKKRVTHFFQASVGSELEINARIYNRVYTSIFTAVRLWVCVCACMFEL